LTDLNKQEEEWKRTIRDLERRFKDEVDQLGIAGYDIQNEIPKLVDEQLPSIYEQIFQSCQDNTFQKAVQYYISFVSFMSGKDAIQTFDLIPALRFMCQGKSSILEWKEAKGETIDYDPNELEAYKPVQLDNTAAVESRLAEIDWGFDTSEYNDDIPVETAVKEIDFGDYEFESSGDVVDIEPTISHEDTLKQIYEWKTSSILSDTDTRNLFWNDIVELDAFISQRIIEKSQSSATSTTVEGEIFKNAPVEIQNESFDELNRFKTAVATALDQLHSSRFKQLLSLKTSKRFVERTTRSLNQKLEMINVLTESVSNVDTKREELNEKIIKIEPQMDVLIDKTRSEKEELQERISKLVPKNRRVNIFGDINLIL
jgi:hypothetical protein